MNSRRRFLKTCSLAMLAPVLGCRALRGVGGATVPESIVGTVDLSFAELVLAGAGRDELAAHPAIAALMRHQAMAGNPALDPGAIVAGILGSPLDRARTSAVLEHWRARTSALTEAMRAARAYLPPGSPLPQHLYAVTGYDIGVAAPPDVVLNASHERFLGAPGEGIYYACHEAHHVGFLSHRQFPDVTALGGPHILGEVVDFITQMEGMAVHAARPLRAYDGHLGADPDYQVYLDPDRAADVTAAWIAMRARCGTTEVDDSTVIGEVLDAMTSGGRLAYMYGAILCERIEQEQGRSALVATILDPAAFFERRK